MPVPRFLVGIGFVVAVACAPATAGAPAAEGASRGDSKTITESELSGATQLNLYDYVMAARPRWLRSTGSMNRNGFPLLIFVGDTRLGGAQTLKSLTTSTVRIVRYYEASAAQQKFAGQDIGPVIHVLLK